MKKEDKQITLSFELAKEMVAGENEQLKKLAIETYPELGEITTVEQAVKYLGELDETVITLRALQSVLKENHYSLVTQELIVVVKALNNGRKFDWSDVKEVKYNIWWDLEDNCFIVVDCFYRCASMSSRLCLNSDKDVKHLVEHFNDKLKIYFKGW